MSEDDSAEQSACAEKSACAVCGEAAQETCALCEQTAYCGPRHQQQHWPQHRARCSPHTVAVSEKLGSRLTSSYEALRTVQKKCRRVACVRAHNTQQEYDGSDQRPGQAAGRGVAAGQSGDLLDGVDSCGGWRLLAATEHQ